MWDINPPVQLSATAMVSFFSAAMIKSSFAQQIYNLEKVRDR
jgi:hypothetical protein